MFESSSPKTLVQFRWTFQKSSISSPANSYIFCRQCLKKISDNPYIQVGWSLHRCTTYVNVVHSHHTRLYLPIPPTVQMLCLLSFSVTVWSLFDSCYQECVISPCGTVSCDCDYQLPLESGELGLMIPLSIQYLIVNMFALLLTSPECSQFYVGKISISFTKRFCSMISQ